MVRGPDGPARLEGSGARSRARRIVPEPQGQETGLSERLPFRPCLTLPFCSQPAPHTSNSCSDGTVWSKVLRADTCRQDE